jgi:TonB-dependent starch-binding outer membrane protein SusC
MNKHRSTLRRVLFLFVALAFFGMSWAQTRAINGEVKDTTGEPVIGASVVVTGTTTGTITDLNGKFRIDVTAGARTLDVSYVGMKKQVVPISATFLSIILVDESRDLEELVVIGYGVVKKRDLTGSVASVKATDIMKTTLSNPLQAMQAKVPGLDIRQNDGQAGSGLSMTLRGNRSISASNSPLILVDGVEYGSTIDINASDIESMDILKDAASTAIYGTKGANGVIIITTKRGKAGRTSVSLNSYVSSNIPTHIPQVMYGQREVQFLIDKRNYQLDAASGNWGTANTTVEQVLTGTPSGADFTEMDVYNAGDYTDWLSIILQNGMTQNYEASISGGTEKTNFNASVGAMYEGGLMKNDMLDRYNAKLTLDHKISDMFKVGSSMLFTYRDHDSRNSSVFGQSLKMTTITRPYNNDGTLLNTPNARYAAHSNPLLDEIEGAYVRNIESTRFFGNSYVEVTPIKGMTFKSMFALDRTNRRDGQYQDYESVSRYQSPSTSYISLTYSNNTRYTWDNILNYSKSVGQHDVTGLLGHSMTKSVNENLSTFGDAGKEHLYTSLFYDVSKILTPKSTSGFTQHTLLSYFGRFNYSYAGKYLLSASVRADGSSALAEGNKWGYFPSLSGGWRVIDEGFMEGTKAWMSNLKLRASWGISGNAAIDPYQTLSQLSGYDLYYTIGGKDIAGRIPSQMGNSELKWETTRAANFGIDFGFFNNRISGSVDYYRTNTNDLLFLRTAPASQVFTTVLSNVGETRGEGIEVSLNTLVAKTKSFSYDINWSYSSGKDEVVALTDGIDKYQVSGAEWLMAGQPVRIFYDFETNGVWNVGEFAEYKTDWEARHPGETLNYVANGAPNGYGNAGTLKIIDSNDDGKLNSDDRRVYDRSPKHIFGMNNTIEYKNFSLSMLLYARLGGYIAYALNNEMNYETANWADLDYWTPANTTAKFPSPGAASAVYSSYSTALRYEVADYIKLKDVTLTYTLPAQYLKSLNVRTLKVFGSLKNYFTFGSIPNYDPERGGAVTFPLAKQAVVGVNLEF